MNASLVCRLVLFASFSSIVASGCGRHVDETELTAGASKPAASSPVTKRPSVTANLPKAPTPVGPAPLVTYRFASAASSIKFTGSDAKGSREGSFGSFSGEIVVPAPSVDKFPVESERSRSTVTVDIDMASLETGDPALTAELKSPRFFDVAKYPKAHFASTSMKLGGVLGATDTVTGNLDLHGVTKTIDIPATVHVDVGDVLVQADFPLNLKDFGVVYEGKTDARLNDQVVLVLVIRANRT
ncbi:MAG: YceI family protein [Polyangiaceae bacterium]|jgi:polyisoprenoid-binding protein YceI